MNTTRDDQIDEPRVTGDDIVVEPVPATVEVQQVVTTEPRIIDGGVIQDVVPRVVTETENINVEGDGSVTRRVARVEQNPVRRRRSTIVPALLIILALALGAIAAAWYFSQSDTTSVPAVEGLALDDAVTRLQDDGLKADITSQPNAAAQGIVFRQSPAAGADADDGSIVRLLVSTGPADVAVPNAVGVGETEARDRVAAAGLQVNVVRIFSPSAIGAVVAQSPTAGVSAAKGSVVRLNVSKGSALVSVPSVVGTSQADAAAQLEAAGLRVNIVQVPSEESAGTVVAQNPAGGQADRGSSVRLNVSAGP